LSGEMSWLASRLWFTVLFREDVKVAAGLRDCLIKIGVQKGESGLGSLLWFCWLLGNSTLPYFQHGISVFVRRRLVEGAIYSWYYFFSFLNRYIVGGWMGGDKLGRNLEINPARCYLPRYP
jgi:hypothetical protein